MHYLAKFCRICIRTDGKLLDISSKDCDSIKFSEKLETCAQMVITEESLSTKICTHCVKKLRISYQFHSMCKKSTAILEQHLFELIKNYQRELNQEKYVCTDLFVKLPPIQKKCKKKRIKKEERCSLLKKLLVKINQDQVMEDINENASTKVYTNFKNLLQIDTESYSAKINLKSDLSKLVEFMKTFDYGYKLENSTTIFNNCDLTPLEKLQHFTDTFFFDHFNDYKNTIFYLNDTDDFESSDEDCMFDPCEILKTENKNMDENKTEEIILEPDIIIKNEMSDDDHKNENNECDFSYYTSNLAQACYNENSNDSSINVKVENKDEAFNLTTLSNSENSFRKLNPVENNSNNCNLILPTSSSGKRARILSQEKKRSVKVKRSFSSHYKKGSTKANHYIHPLLKSQFLYQSFLCDVCNRCFKSLGYLKAHKSKVKH